MEADLIQSWEAHVGDYLYGPEGLEQQGLTSPWSQRGLDWARDKLKLIGKHFRTAPKRNAAPPWSLPLELFWILFHPYRRTSRRFRGLGYEQATLELKGMRTFLKKYDAQYLSYQ
eukprot:2574304-Pyramimonas_sp.AAC.1